MHLVNIEKTCNNAQRFTEIVAGLRIDEPYRDGCLAGSAIVGRITGKP